MHVSCTKTGIKRKALATQNGRRSVQGQCCHRSRSRPMRCESLHRKLSGPCRVPCTQSFCFETPPYRQPQKSRHPAREHVKPQRTQRLSHGILAHSPGIRVGSGGGAAAPKRQRRFRKHLRSCPPIRRKRPKTAPQVNQLLETCAMSSSSLYTQETCPTHTLIPKSTWVSAPSLCAAIA